MSTTLFGSTEPTVVPLLVVPLYGGPLLSIRQKQIAAATKMHGVLTPARDHLCTMAKIC